MTWPSLDVHAVVERLTASGNHDWLVRSWMVDRHEVLTTALVNLESALPLMCGIDLLTSDDIGTDGLLVSPWWLAEDGSIQRALSQRLADVPNERTFAALLVSAIDACETSNHTDSDSTGSAVHFEVELVKLDELLGRRLSPLDRIERATGATIEIDEARSPAILTARSSDPYSLAEAHRAIEELLNPPVPVEGAVFRGRVVNITKFGAFVNILPGRDGLIHISQLSGLTPDGQHVNKVEEVLQLGQALDVRVEEIDSNGKISLGLAEAQSAEEPDAPSLPASETPGSESRR